MDFKYFSPPLIIAFLMLSAVFASCKKDENISPEETTSFLRFYHEVDGATLEYDTLRYVNAYGNTYSIETVRYFISNIEFAKANGETIPIDTAIYIDPRNPDYNLKSYTTPFPNGTYSELRFTFGLNSIMNKTGAFPDFPETAMEWPIPMGGGYHYMKLEGKYLEEESYNHFNFHTGPLDGNQNYFQVVLPMDLVIDTRSFDLSLVMEIQNWFKNPHTFDLSAISGGMMGDQERQEMVKANGHDVFKVK